mmetsp:Transcript_6152/g.15006  ORF Transcript_6152/g.15006 Transcript_6152/m.15006 type:complete len:256 (-) Transcript_6152:1263-2030(-)
MKPIGKPGADMGTGGAGAVRVRGEVVMRRAWSNRLRPFPPPHPRLPSRPPSRARPPRPRLPPHRVPRPQAAAMRRPTVATPLRAAAAAAAGEGTEAPGLPTALAPLMRLLLLLGTLGPEWHGPRGGSTGLAMLGGMKDGAEAPPPCAGAARPSAEGGGRPGASVPRWLPPFPPRLPQSPPVQRQQRRRPRPEPRPPRRHPKHRAPRRPVAAAAEEAAEGSSAATATMQTSGGAMHQRRWRLWRLVWPVSSPRSTS